MTLRFDLKDTEAVVFIEEGDTFDQPGEAFVELLGGLLLQNNVRLTANGGEWCLPIIMHQRFDLAFVKVGNLFQ